MKKLVMTLIFIFTVFFYSINVYANMAAPLEPSYSNSITFEKNQEIAVTEEIIDIRVKSVSADILVVYKMKNLTNNIVSTPSMFISPNINDQTVSIKANDNELEYDIKEYYLGKKEDVSSDGWEYVILTDQSHGNAYSNKVATIRFNLTFSPSEELDVRVAYKYNLGGYPHLDFDSKCGVIEYYLRPAQMWKDFKKLTINLYLDDDLPRITKSTLPFERLKERHYQYVTDELPETDLVVNIDQSRWNEWVSWFKSPYLVYDLMMIVPVILLFGIPIIIFLVAYFGKKDKKSNKNANNT